MRVVYVKGGLRAVVGNPPPHVDRVAGYPTIGMTYCRPWVGKGGTRSKRMGWAGPDGSSPVRAHHRRLQDCRFAFYWRLQAVLKVDVLTSGEAVAMRWSCSLSCLGTRLINQVEG